MLRCDASQDAERYAGREPGPVRDMDNHNDFSDSTISMHRDSGLEDELESENDGLELGLNCESNSLEQELNSEENSHKDERRSDPMSTNARIYSQDAVSSNDVDWDELADYTYQPLHSPTTIRLLFLDAGTMDEPIRCYIVRVDIDNNPGYHALSYVWGTDPPSHNIMCGNARHTVRRNLFDALRTLRWPDCCRFLWVDAICINQNDVVERGSQVQLMGQIYSKASLTLVWLGWERPELVQTAFGYLCQLVRLNAKTMTDIVASEHRARYRDRFESEHNTYSWKNAPVALAHDCMLPPDEVTIRTRLDPALVALFSNRYFLRGWVIQEVALSSLNWSVFWGDGELQSIYFMTAVDYLKSYESNKLLRNQLAWDGFNGCTAIIDLNRKLSKRSLLQKVQLARHNQFTDPLDRVYGLLGITNTEEDTTGQDVRITPDYNISVAECYKDLAKQHLAVHKDAWSLFISVQPSGNINTQWPSWVPDWTISNTRIEIVQFIVELKKDGWVETGQAITPFMHNDRECVMPRGYRIARVHHVLGGRLSTDGEAPWEAETEHLRCLLRKVANLADLAHVALAACVGHSSRRSLRAIYLSQIWEPATVAGDVICHIMNCIAFLHDSPTEVVERDMERYRDDYPEQFGDVSALAFEIKVRQALTGRVFFGTNTGWVCVGPDMVGENDEIVLFYGCPVPFILRPTADGTWYILGECYVPSEDVSKVVKEKLKKRERFEKFIIC